MTSAFGLAAILFGGFMALATGRLCGSVRTIEGEQGIALGSVLSVSLLIAGWWLA